MFCLSPSCLVFSKCIWGCKCFLEHFVSEPSFFCSAHSWSLIDEGSLPSAEPHLLQYFSLSKWTEISVALLLFVAGLPYPMCQEDPLCALGLTPLRHLHLSKHFWPCAGVLWYVLLTLAPRTARKGPKKPCSFAHRENPTVTLASPIALWLWVCMNFSHLSLLLGGR
jgi:hypothetical protein